MSLWGLTNFRMTIFRHNYFSPKPFDFIKVLQGINLFTYLQNLYCRSKWRHNKHSRRYDLSVYAMSAAKDYKWIARSDNFFRHDYFKLLQAHCPLFLIPYFTPLVRFVNFEIRVQTSCFVFSISPQLFPVSVYFPDILTLENIHRCYCILHVNFIQIAAIYISSKTFRYCFQYHLER